MFEGDSDDDTESSLDQLDTMNIGRDAATEDTKVGPLEVIISVCHHYLLLQ